MAEKKKKVEKKKKGGKGIEELSRRIEELNSVEMIERQHQKGKLSARERILLLLDEETFVELDPFIEPRFEKLGMDKKKIPGDAVITGFGKINNRPVYISSQDFSKIGGSLGEMHGNKIVKVIKLARTTGCPMISIIDSGGARIQEGLLSLDGYAAIFREMIKASGVIPQISVIVGPSAGGASYAPGLSDFVFMVQDIAQMYITGPAVIQRVTGEKVSFEELGGSSVHNTKSGCSHFSFNSEKDCFSGVKRLLTFLPQNNLENPMKDTDIFSELFERDKNKQLLKIVPEKQEKGYDMKEIIEEVFDTKSFFEVQSGFAKNSIIGFAKLGGNVVGIVGNQPKVMAGTLDIDSSDKIARFVRTCDSFNVPLINLVDTSGYLPGSNQEKRGIIRHGAKILFAFSEATVPKISLILRKAYGGAYIALASRKLGYDIVIAWPSAQIAVMGPEQAVKIIYRKDIAKSKNPARLEKSKIKELENLFLNPYQAAKLGQIDMIIDPQETRMILIKCLESLTNKRGEKIARKHGNIPL